MAKDKERTVNPAAAQRKAEKQRALKKSKAAVAAQRNERLAHRNPERLQRQIDELKALESSKGQLAPRDKTTLADLERDVARIRKAKELAGDNGVPSRAGRDDRHGHNKQDQLGSDQVLGKRGRSPSRRRFDRRGGSRSDSSATDEDVRNIPMPRDTPPPIPFRRHRQHRPGGHGNNMRQQDHEGGEKPIPAKTAPVASQTVYESKPVLRDLRKEAVGFVPSTVKRKMDAVKGGVDQPLLEAEDMDKLEQEGYIQRPGLSGVKDKANNSSNTDADIDNELSRFANEVKRVQIEEVEDEDG